MNPILIQSIDILLHIDKGKKLKKTHVSTIKENIDIIQYLYMQC